MPLKRKASEFDESDEDEPSFGRQTLPVANLPETFDGNPEDGLQYLFTVRREFNQLPHITRVHNPFQLPTPPPQSPQKVGPSALPSEEWRTLFERRFKNLRKNVVQPTFHVSHPTVAPAEVLPDMKDRDRWWAFVTGRPKSEWNSAFRPVSNKKLKNEFFRQRELTRAKAEAELRDPLAGQLMDYGYTEITNDTYGEPSAADPSRAQLSPQRPPWHTGPMHDAYAPPANYSTPIFVVPLPTPSLSPHPPEGALASKPPEPTPQLMELIDHRYAVHLLMYFEYWLTQHLNRCATSTFHPSGDEPSLSHLRWIFALLTRVEDFITADETSQLRGVARACVGLIKIRLSSSGVRGTSIASSSEGDDKAEDGEIVEDAFVGPCWMVVAAVAGVWAQRDLWMDAEEALSAS